MNIPKLQKQLCEHLCRSIQLHERDDGMVMVENPFTFPDGDTFSLYLSPIAEGKYKLSDLANVAMRLSYDEDDVRKYFDERRAQGRRMRQILREMSVKEESGEFFVESTTESLADDILRLSQALTQIYDLTLLSREHSPSTFYDDLEQIIGALLAPSFITKGHFFECDKKKEYPTDYYLQNPKDTGRTLCVYGIPSKDKAQLVTIILQYLQKNNLFHDSLLVFRDQSNIPPQTLGRLSNVGGEQISSLGAVDDLDRKIQRRVFNGSGSPRPSA